MLTSIKQKLKLDKKDTGEFSKIKVKGMNFTIEQYYAKGIGNISFMQAKGFFGLMQMDTLIINPTECDMPLFSYDRVHAMGNDTLILELYDTCISPADLSALEKIKKEYQNLPEHDLGSHWYDTIKLKESDAKKGKKKETAAFDKFAADYLESYLELIKQAPSCMAEQKKEKASVYVEGLLTHGGPSTDIFKQHYGEEKTADLFRNILFGTK